MLQGLAQDYNTAHQYGDQKAIQGIQQQHDYYRALQQQHAPGVYHAPLVSYKPYNPQPNNLVYQQPQGAAPQTLPYNPQTAKPAVPATLPYAQAQVAKALQPAPMYGMTPSQAMLQKQQMQLAPTPEEIQRKNMINAMGAAQTQNQNQYQAQAMAREMAAYNASRGV
jgi:hypothetical protein